MSFGACLLGALVALVLMVLFPPGAGGAPAFSPWAEPENLGCEVNSPFDDTGPAISKNGLSLFFSSTDNLGFILNTEANEAVPTLSRDEHWLFFNSNRDGSSDIWVSWRPHVHDDFGWQTPMRLGEEVNSPQFEAGASYFENEEAGLPQLFLGKGASAVTSDIDVSELQLDGSFGQAVVVPELSGPQAEQRPSIRFDGLEMFLGRLVSTGNFDLFVSTRASVFDPWERPISLGPTINSTVDDAQPYIATDRRTLFFSSLRSGGCGGGDLYMTTRTRTHPNSDD